ncbi:MAG: biotin synthase BioB [Chitinispirillaceae bacterium]|nr:biotin synthase BioB [Chitinispirillaceae bacterium]
MHNRRPLSAAGATKQRFDPQLTFLRKESRMNLFEAASRLYSHAIDGGIDPAGIDAVIDWPKESLSVLFAATDQVRRRFYGTTVDPCSLMNVKSGGCSEDCAFCAQSGHNSASVGVTGLADPEEIKKRLALARGHDLPFCVVSSGRRLTRNEIRTICSALKDVSGEKHASLGILDDGEFALLRDAGVVCYNHNLETSRSFFPKIVSTHTWEERVATVKRAKAAGLRVCCGGIFGVGETWADRREFCLQIRGLDVDIIPLNFFNPVPGTRLAPPVESPLDFLKIVAFFRLVMPAKTIKVCGGRELHLGGLQGLMFFAGANGYVSGGYLTTPGAGIDADDMMIAGLGLKKRGVEGFNE